MIILLKRSVSHFRISFYASTFGNVHFILLRSEFSYAVKRKNRSVPLRRALFWYFWGVACGLRRVALCFVDYCCASGEVLCFERSLDFGLRREAIFVFLLGWSGSPKRSILHFYPGEMCLRKGLLPPKMACASEEGLCLRRGLVPPKRACDCLEVTFSWSEVYGANASCLIGCLLAQTIAIN